MKIKNFTYLLLFNVILITSCSEHKIDLKNFNSESWKKDRYGCLNTRHLQINAINEIKDGLIGTKEAEARSIFGRPDREVLDERMKKTLYYFIEPGAKCNSVDNHKIKALSIELESLNRAVKLIVVQEIPLDK